MNDYTAKLEAENEKLRKQLREYYMSSQLPDHLDLYTDSDEDCHHVGISGRCGNECPVFLNGKCEVTDEILEWVDKEIETLKELRQMYETD